MLFGTTPDIINHLLNNLPKDQAGNTGYAQGNLVYWGRLPEIFANTTVRRVWDFNAQDIDANVPTIVQVNGSPIGAPVHFVLYIGENKLIDPWDGKVKPVGTYTAQSYAVIKGEGVASVDSYYKGLDLTNEESMKVAVDVWDRLQKGELIEKSMLQTMAADVGITDPITDKEGFLDRFKKKITEYISYAAQVADYRKRYEDEQLKNIDLNSALSKVSGENQDNAVKAYESEHLANARGDYLHMVADKLDITYNPSDEKVLIEEILREIEERNRKLSEAPHETQLSGILKILIAMGINNYLIGKGYKPIDATTPDSQVVTKVNEYLSDMANELITAKSPDPLSPVPSSPVLHSIPKRKTFLEWVVGLFIEGGEK